MTFGFDYHELELSSKVHCTFVRPDVLSLEPAVVLKCVSKLESDLGLGFIRVGLGLV